MSGNYSTTDIIGEFRDFILEAGFQSVPPIEPGKIHRFPGKDKKPSNRAGYAKMFDDCRGGFCGDYSTGFSATWQAERRDDFTPEENARFKREINQAKRQQHKSAALRALEIVRGAVPESGTHRYLFDKQIQPHGVLTSGYALVIVIRSISGDIQSIQHIYPDGRKQFLKGGKITGGLYLIGDLNPDGKILICEGFATGATLFEETNIPVVVAFNANNLKPVSVSIRKKYPKSEIIICGDNDRNTEGNPGVKAATEAALAVSGKISIPEFSDSLKGTDWNDWYLNQREAMA